MNRITVAMVRNAYARFCRAAEGWGYEPSSWFMTEGSNGEAWRVGRTKCVGPMIPGVDDYGIIGYSRREAFDTLSTIARTLETLEYPSK